MSEKENKPFQLSFSGLLKVAFQVKRTFMPKKSLIVISLALLTSIPTFAQEADGLKVTLGDIQFEVPGSFEERPDLAVASQLWAPGRFQFREGRAFYHPSSADILQVYSSDNPLVGLNHKKAQKKFLEDFGKDSKGGLQPILWRSLLTTNTAKWLAQPLPKDLLSLAKYYDTFWFLGASIYVWATQKV